MSLFDFLKSSLVINANPVEVKTSALDSDKYAFADVEVSVCDGKIKDIGAIRYDDALIHTHLLQKVLAFLEGVDYICGHNIVHHDAKYFFPEGCDFTLVDTLYVSPLLFPAKPYHKLVKDDKLLSDQLNNPVNDCKKAKELLFDEVAAWNSLSENKRKIYSALLYDKEEFFGFLSFVHAVKAGENFSASELGEIIKTEFKSKLCTNADFDSIISSNPVELAYALAIIGTSDYKSITPGWVLHRYPAVENVIWRLRGVPCNSGCEYCAGQLDIHSGLKKFFGFDDFRKYNGESLQENAAQCAVDGKSLLAIFPTGGGKSLTFQLPALMAGRAVHGLTVVISPLQSLMKDQVDNLEERGITDAVAINGLLDPISRADAIDRVMHGDASLLYISPEMLRSKTIEKILLVRNVVRFVIDEAHCFSAWGQDFRVDYLYIGKFIKIYQEKKKCTSIPVSCFTATAKQKVIQDICDYFNKWIGVELNIFATSASRKNLRYSVIHVDGDDEKYYRLRSLIDESRCPTIVYVSRTKRTKDLADRLTRDGYMALPYNGKMDSDKKIRNQDAFMSGDVDIIVATSAFGMGVDKSDVKLVVHYDISDSLENYIQEAGRAGRNPQLEARCFVLYNDSDLDKHFILLNQTKLSISEIQQVWQAVKYFSKFRPQFACSALEIARQAGWDDTVSDIETRVCTALSALEQSGYIERGNNIPHVYATGITVKNVDEARNKITNSSLFENPEIENAVRIIKSLITQKYISKSENGEAESRVDYLADILGLKKSDVINTIERMRLAGVLADSKDITAYLSEISANDRKSKKILDRYSKLERYILTNIPDDSLNISYKQLNDNALRDKIDSTEKDIRTLLYFHILKGYTRRKNDDLKVISVERQGNLDLLLKRFEKRLDICNFAIEWLYGIISSSDSELVKDGVVQFSIVKLLNDMKMTGGSLFVNFDDVQLEDVEEALLYMSKIGALKLEGGFLVIYNTMDIKRIKEPRCSFKIEDYKILDEFYKQKIQQIHIVGEYANLMVTDYNAALGFVRDYFQMNYRDFISTYFKGDKLKAINKNITPEKYDALFGTLSPRQEEIIRDKESKCIVVAAGPGSGKTRVLVHKLASLLLLEDVKHEQLLMLTFSRLAAVEFKLRLMELIGNAAHFVDIMTFHSYCFDLLGRIGNLDDSQNIISMASEMIENGEVEPNKIRKTVLVIDEAQDMNEDSYRLVCALKNANENMRVIAVGDDDQCIFDFAGANPKYMYQLSTGPESRIMEMTDNYRSCGNVVAFANAFTRYIPNRLKTSLIVAVKDIKGRVKVVRHSSKYMFTPVVSDFLNSKYSGTTAMLTQTNEEAVILLALLKKYRIPCKLIQSMGGLRFGNLTEVRFFLRYLTSNAVSPVISSRQWEEAKCAVKEKYAGSTSLPYLERCLSTFEKTNRSKYLNDLKEFIYESNIEDFTEIGENEVVVSTIHKAKGREFDNVYLLIDGNHVVTGEKARSYYVAITRAKCNLSIHTNTAIFNSLPAEIISDNNDYFMPDEIVLQLSHRDVMLSYFKYHQSEILSLKSGDPVVFKDNHFYLADGIAKIGKLSARMQKEIETWAEKGYKPIKAKVRFIVAWKAKDAPKEEQKIAIVLADLLLKKSE